MSVGHVPGDLVRLERLAHEALDVIAAVNDAEVGQIDRWALTVATVQLERALDAMLVILGAGKRDG